MTYSFNVFDTCLCRLCGEPRNLFEVLSLKVQRLMGENNSEHMRQLFVAARCESDGLSLEDIYQHVAENYPPLFPVRHRRWHNWNSTQSVRCSFL